MSADCEDLRWSCHCLPPYLVLDLPCVDIMHTFPQRRASEDLSFFSWHHFVAFVDATSSLNKIQKEVHPPCSFNASIKRCEIWQYEAFKTSQGYWCYLPCADDLSPGQQSSGVTAQEIANSERSQLKHAMFLQNVNAIFVQTYSYQCPLVWCDYSKAMRQDYTLIILKALIRLYLLLQGLKRSRKPLLLPRNTEIKISAYKGELQESCLSDCDDGSFTADCEAEQMPCRQLFDSEKGIVWSPNAAYNADLSCFTWGEISGRIWMELAAENSLPLMILCYPLEIWGLYMSEYFC